ncbi:MAG TPA: hypothetical protein VIN56_05945, partial [Candidatus Dormibacteraeota bacterium]
DSGAFTAAGVINANGGISTSNGGPLNLTSANLTVAVTGALTSGGGVVTLADGANKVVIDGSGTTVTGVANLLGATTVGSGCPFVPGAQLTVCGDTSTSGKLTAVGVSNLNGGITAAGGTVSVTGNLTATANFAAGATGTITGYQLISTTPGGGCPPIPGACVLTPSPPLLVASHDLVTNLNANYLEGHPAADFALSAAVAPATGSNSYIQNCAVPANACPAAGQAANLNVTNTGLLGSPVTAALTSTVGGVNALRVVGGASFTGATTFDGTTAFNTGLATFNAGLTVAAGQSTILNGTLTVAAGQLTTLNGGLTVAQGGATILQTGVGTITLGPITPLTAFTVNATTTTLNGNATITGNATLVGDLIGGNFTGTCAAPAAMAAPSLIVCQTQVTGVPKEVVVTPSFNAGAFYVDTLAVNLSGKGTFTVHFPANAIILGNAVYYVVVR